jgi:hypothetical protein
MIMLIFQVNPSIRRGFGTTSLYLGMTKAFMQILKNEQLYGMVLSYHTVSYH